MMFSKVIKDPTSLRSVFSNLSVTTVVSLIAAFIVLPLAGFGSGPTVTAPAPKELRAAAASQDAGSFSIAGFSGTLLATVAIKNPPGGTTFSITSNTGLTPTYGYGSWSSITEISFTGSSTDVQIALNNIKINTGGIAGNVELTVSVMPYDANYAFNPVNQSFYKVETTLRTWEAAKTFAEGTTYNGVPGYLATITSLQENQFITNRISASATSLWIGASDKVTEGTWRWETGPEAGTAFWQGAASGTRIGSNFASWAPGEPNNGGGNQDYALTNWNGAGTWDDQGPTSTNKSLIEYSATEANSFTSLRTANVIHKIVLPTITLTTERKILAANVSAASSSGIRINGYATSSVVRVSVVMKNADPVANFSIATTAGLTRAPGFTSWTTTRDITFTGSQDDINAALDKLTLKTPPENGVMDLQVTAVEVVPISKNAADGDIAFNPENGHYYQFISANAITFTSAKNAARAKTYIGLTGYLTTITSKSENDFVTQRIDKADNVWIGASDRRAEGIWEWVDGPENGVQFFRQSSPRGPIDSRFSSWASGEPNNYGSGEHYAVTNWGGSKGLWNDLPDSAGAVKGYVVEFSGVSNVAPPIITETFRYNVGVAIQQFSNQAIIEVPPPDSCSPTALAVSSATCRLVISAIPTPATSSLDRLDVTNCSPGTACTVSPLGDYTYRYEFEVILEVPTFDVVRYLGTGLIEIEEYEAFQEWTNGAPTPTFTATREVQRFANGTSVVEEYVTNGQVTVTLTREVERNTLDQLLGECLAPVGQSCTPSGPALPSTYGTERELAISGTTTRFELPGADSPPPLPTPPTAQDFESARDEEGSGGGTSSSSTATTPLPLVPDNNQPGRRPRPNASPGTSGSPSSSGVFGTPDSLGATGPGSPSASGPLGPGVVALLPTLERTPNVVYSPTNPIPQDLLALLQSPLAYEASASGQPLLPQLAPTESAANENGAPVSVEIVVSDSGNGYLLIGDGWTVSLEATDSSGEPLLLDNSGNIILNSDRFVQFGGDGFAPGSFIKVWLFSDPTSLGNVTAGVDGSFTGQAMIPDSIAEGEHTIQLNGLTKDGQVRSVALGVLIQPEVVVVPPMPNFGMLNWILLILSAIVGTGLIGFILWRRKRKDKGQQAGLDDVLSGLKPTTN